MRVPGRRSRQKGTTTTTSPRTQMLVRVPDVDTSPPTGRHGDAMSETAPEVTAASISSLPASSVAVDAARRLSEESPCGTSAGALPVSEQRGGREMNDDESSRSRQGRTAASRAVAKAVALTGALVSVAAVLVKTMPA